ncbi:hypothetical protein A6E13_20025 [Aliivibrio fischeri]|uniref:hypothetical protein n=1 Tax=Aliivibrio fischeri TaxID=668 RepID=UPI00080E398B|nr:hypothetical protein [Aliivibrio fischeri]OCH26147.1 hypothetical protein A6E13_20025 [Aliivibrio fischeri]
MGYDHSKKYIDVNAMETYVSIDNEITKLYGKTVKAMEISNIDYKQRYLKLNKSRRMKSPPSCGRIFLGFVVVRNLNTKKEYETWIPDIAFGDMYELRK